MKLFPRFSTLARLSAMVAVCVVLAACGSKIKGTYTDSTNTVTADFDGSNVKMTMAGMTSPPMPYKVEGKTIKLDGGGDMTINDDGSLDAPGGMKLVKK